METQVICENPRYILNPALPELLLKHRVLYIDGRETKVIKPLRHYFDKSYKKLFYPNPTKDYVENSFVLDTETSETYPAYICVPCGHCFCCKDKKINSFVHRCKLETMCYPNRPWFVTLTYNDNTCPDCGLYLPDVQKFFKRFRQSLHRRGFTDKIRYVCVGEYGKNTHRPHYHAIIWNLHETEFCSLLDISKLLDKCWDLGYTMSRVIDPANDKAFYYTAKYLKKDCVLPFQDAIPPFLVSSRRNGGIGAKYIDNLAISIRMTNNITPKFLNRFSGKTEDLQLSSYVLGRIFPSKSKLIPSELRKNVRLFMSNYAVLRATEPDLLWLYDDAADSCRCRFKSLFPYVDIDFTSLPASALTIRGSMEQQRLIIEHYTNMEFGDVEALSSQRNYYLSKLFLHAHSIDISARSHSAKRQFALAAARERL